MISVSRKKWVEKKVNKNLIEKIKQDYNLNDILARLIVSRNFDVTEINNINNNLSITNIFSKINDFEISSDILINSINKNEKICILGDYDVDGTCATSLLVRFLNHINHKYFYYIPDRVKDGYGATKKLFKKLLSQKPKLIIMVDCGSTSNEAIDFLNKNNISSIIIDHHEINKPYPKSNVIINPKKDTDYAEYDYLCATTLTFFFIHTVIQKIKSNFRIFDFLVYVLLATICDVMPLRKFNKLIALHVIRNFQIKDNLAFKFIFDHFKIKKKMTVEDLGFLIGPIINSGGRLGFSNYGTEILTSDNHEIIKKKSLKLINLNKKRKQLEKNILSKINFNKIKKENKKVIIYYDQKINEGLIGIIASRLKDYFNKPSIVITKSNNILKASARSTENFNISQLIKILIEHKIIENGGGHNMAAGFSLKKNNIELLDNFIQKYYMDKIKFSDLEPTYDFELSASAINLSFFDEINKLGPFGNQNFSPIFLIKNVKVIKSYIINGSHVNAIIKYNKSTSVKSICFNCVDTLLGEYLLSYKKNINIIAEITKNTWNNKSSIQLNIKDLVLRVNSA